LSSVDEADGAFHWARKLIFMRFTRP